MSQLQTKKHSDISPTSPHTSINSIREKVPNDPQEQPPKPFSSNAQFRGNLLVLLQRFFLTSLSLALLAVALWGFSKMGHLDKATQRGFNTLSILLPGMASLALGSLISHLGSMLRWPLLARTKHKMQDVDSILGMSPPTGALRLIKRHIRERRISRTTLIVTLYFITNILGRLSVAIFGLTYDQADQEGIKHPTLATNWTSALWTRRLDISGKESYEYEIRTEFLISVWNGFRSYIGISELNGPYSNSSGIDFGDNSPILQSDLSIPNTTLELGKDTGMVEYWYDLKDFENNNVKLSNHTVHSAVNCSLIEVEQDKYWRWDKWNRTGPFSWGEDSTGILPRTLWKSYESTKGLMQEANYTFSPIAYPHWASFEASSNGSHAPSQIYILCYGIAWECWPTLTETVRTKPHEPIPPNQQLFYSRNLYGLSGVRGIGSIEQTDPNVAMSLVGTAASPAQAALEPLATVCNNTVTFPLNETVWNEYGLWVSAVVARLPILAIMDSNLILPRIAPGAHPNQTGGTAYVYKSIKVEWLDVALVVTCITLGQLLAILLVLYYCNGVYTRDDSSLATAELLKTVINRFDGGKLMTGEELAVSLDGVLGTPVSYGTREGQGSGPPEVDLASDLDAMFPPCPPGQRFWKSAR